MTQDQTSEPPRGPLPPVTVLPEEETAKRIQLFATMLGAFPVARNQSLEITLDGYLVLTADIPLGWLATAVKRVMLHPDTIYAPAIGQIRQAAAIEITRSRRVAQGDDPDRQGNGKPVACPAEHIDARIAWARQVVGLPEIAPASTAVYRPPELAEGIVRPLDRSDG